MNVAKQPDRQIYCVYIENAGPMVIRCIPPGGNGLILTWKDNGNPGQQIPKATKMDFKSEQDLNWNQTNWCDNNEKKYGIQNVKRNYKQQTVSSKFAQWESQKTPSYSLLCQDSKVPTRLSMAKCFSFTSESVDLVDDANEDVDFKTVIIIISLWYHCDDMMMLLHRLHFNIFN